MVSVCLKVIFFVVLGGCSYFLNKALNKVYSKQLRSCDPANWSESWSTLINEP